MWFWQKILKRHMLVMSRSQTLIWNFIGNKSDNGSILHLDVDAIGMGFVQLRNRICISVCNIDAYTRVLIVLFLLDDRAS